MMMRLLLGLALSALTLALVNHPCHVHFSNECASAFVAAAKETHAIPLIASTEAEIGLEYWVNVKFTSPAGSYTTCDKTYTFSEKTFEEEGPDDTYATPWEARMEPEVTWAADRTQLYTVAMVDPVSICQPSCLHWMVVNVGGDEIENGTVVRSYLGPGNPSMTRYNNYTVIVYRQQGPITVSEEDKQAAEAIAFWDMPTFAAKYNLGKIVGMNWLHAKGDRYSTRDSPCVPEGFAVETYARVPSPRSLAYHAESGIVFASSFDFSGISGPQGVPKKAYAVFPNGSSVAIEPAMLVPNGIAVLPNGDLYVAQIDTVWRYSGMVQWLQAGATNGKVPQPQPTVVVGPETLPNNTWHGWKYIHAGPDGKLYLPVGAPCNIPCDQDCDCLANPIFGTIQRFDPDGSNFEMYANGIRNSVGLDFDRDGSLWFTENGRDNWSPNHDNRPPDELNFAPTAGMDFGYPHCYGYDEPDTQFNPQGSCTQYTGAAMELAPHAAALGVRFYLKTAFPKTYHNAAFIAEHGSWNRNPPSGFRVSVVRRDEAGKAVSYEPFVTGFLSTEPTPCTSDNDCPGSAQCQTLNGGGVCGGKGRPADVVILNDGSLIFSDEMGNKIYRVSYIGDEDSAERDASGSLVLAGVGAVVVVVAIGIIMWLLGK